MILSLLLLQTLPVTPLPAPMEPAVNAYPACVDRRLSADDQTRIRSRAFPAIVDKAVSACGAVRIRSIADAEQALEPVRGFADPAQRRAFVADRFDTLDALLREIARGETGLDDDAQD